MADIELVIKIPEKIYESVMDGTYCGTLYQELKNGTPLPKGHGRIGDLDKLEKEIDGGIKAGLMIEGYENYSNINDVDDCLEYVKYAPTIIEADRSEEE